MRFLSVELSLHPVCRGEIFLCIPIILGSPLLISESRARYVKYVQNNKLHFSSSPKLMLNVYLSCAYVRTAHVEGLVARIDIKRAAVTNYVK